jgi:outer membrane biosynthesis protein TonB
VVVPAPLKDIVDTAVAAGSFTTLAAALTKADLVTTMKSAGPFTVFAPTDDAFAAALTKLGLTKEALLAMPELAGILTYHVVAGKVLSTDLSNGMKATTVAGPELTITITGTSVMVGDATVTAADVMCSNGVIHIIDAVLLPPTAPGPEPEPVPEPEPEPSPAPEPEPSPAPEPEPSPSPKTDAAASTAYSSQCLTLFTFGSIVSAYLFA